MAKAVTVIEKVRRRQDIAKSRYERHVLDGIPMEDIAKEDRVTIGTVQVSVDQYKRHLDMCTLETLEASQIDTLLSLQSKERKAIEGMLEAEMTVAEAGQIKSVPDFDTRAKALRIINEKIEAVKPNGKGITVQTGVAVGSDGKAQSQTTVTVTEGGRDFESVLRKVRQARQAQLGEGQDLSLPEGETIQGDVGQAPTEPQSAETST